MKRNRGWLAVLLTLSLVLSGVAIPKPSSAAKKKVKLSKKTATVKVGSKVKITVKNTKKEVKWSIKSGKKYIKLKNVKKKTVTVQGKKAGNAKIQVKVGKKKLVCKIKVKGKSTDKKKDTKKDKVTGTPGKNIDLPAGTTVFNVGGRKLALGITTDNVKTILGNMSNDIIREEKSPQGFDVISYNPAGSYDGYILVYLKDDVVVGLCAVGKNVQYGEGDGTIVSTGTSADTLEKASGWSAETLFDAKEGETKAGTGAYKYTASSPDATVLAYVDHFKVSGNQVYCIQVYSNTYSRSAMLDPNYCNYDAAVLSAMNLETVDILNAYCVFYNRRTLKSTDGLAKAAQDYCSNNMTGGDTPPSEQNSEDLKTAILEQNENDAPLHFAQTTLSMSSDSIGFANSILEQKDSSNYIISLTYVGKGFYGNTYTYYYQYIGIGTAFYQSGSKKYTYMVVDLVDLWEADESW